MPNGACGAQELRWTEDVGDRVGLGSSDSVFEVEARPEKVGGGSRIGISYRWRLVSELVPGWSLAGVSGEGATHVCVPVPDHAPGMESRTWCSDTVSRALGHLPRVSETQRELLGLLNFFPSFERTAWSRRGVPFSPRYRGYTARIDPSRNPISNGVLRGAGVGR